MNTLKDGAFEPDQLTSIRMSFDEVCSILSDLGYELTPDEVERLGRSMIRLSASGIQGDELVDATVRTVLLRKAA